MHKPAELLITNGLYDGLGAINALPPAIRQTLSLNDMQGIVLKHIAVALIGAGSTETILKMVEACGGPKTLEELQARVQAISESQGSTGAQSQ